MLVGDLNDTERRGLRYAGLAALGMIALIALLVVPEGAVLRNPETGGVRLASGTGVFMEELKQMLAEKSITTTFMAIDEKNPGEMRIET